MKNKHILCCIITTILCMSCTKSYYSEMAHTIERQMGSELEAYDYVVIIPGSGCTGCISVAEQFFLDNTSNTRIKFIFTQILSCKMLKIRLKEENIKRQNVLIDDANTFYLHDYEEKVYPHIATVNSKTIINVQNLGNFQF